MDGSKNIFIPKKAWKLGKSVLAPQSPSLAIYPMFRGSDAPVAEQYTTRAWGSFAWKYKCAIMVKTTLKYLKYSNGIIPEFLKQLHQFELLGLLFQELNFWPYGTGIYLPYSINHNNKNKATEKNELD